MPVPKSESAPAPKSAPSSLAVCADEEVGGGANEEVDDEAAARTGKVRAAARISLSHGLAS